MLMRYKQFNVTIKDVNEQSYTMRFVFNSSTEDRQGEVVKPGSWRLDNFMANPVVLFTHDHYQPAVGQASNLAYNSEGQLEGDVKFAAEEYPFAMTLWKLYKGGYMRAVSVGFQSNDVSQRTDGLTELGDNELFELSLVNVPADARALAKQKGIDLASIDDITKSVVPYHDYGNSDEGTAWDGPAQVAGCGDDMAKLKAICAWYDSASPDVKSSYKLPHHLAESKEAVWRGVAAAMGALLGGRGGVDMPEEDRKGVYNHLAKHYEDFGKDVPEFKACSDVEIKAITDGIYTKESRVLSTKNRQTLTAARDAILEVLAADDASRSSDTGKSAIQRSTTPSATGARKFTVSQINKAVRLLLQTKVGQQ